VKTKFRKGRGAIKQGRNEMTDQTNDMQDRAQQVRDLVAASREQSTGAALDTLRAALDLIANAMEPCEDCGRKEPPVIDPADDPATGLDPAQLEAAAQVIDMQTRQALEG
jgi:hypothetical protein